MTQCVRSGILRAGASINNGPYQLSTTISLVLTTKIQPGFLLEKWCILLSRPHPVHMRRRVWCHMLGQLHKCGATDKSQSGLIKIIHLQLHSFRNWAGVTRSFSS